MIVEDVVVSLERRYGKAAQVGRSRILKFGHALTCSINYSKLLGGHKFFFGVAKEVVDEAFKYPRTAFGDFVLLVCGSADKTLVLPRSLIIQMLRGVPTRRIDVFCEDGAYILQTTKHPKLNVTEFLNALPNERRRASEQGLARSESTRPDRVHVKMQWALARLGRAEGCSVWVPPNDRNLAYRKESLADHTLNRLPNFGFDENTRRIVQNIDVLWLTKNVIRKAFEVESSTTIYSGLLRMNDLVLAQPNNQMDLYVVASRARREKVFNQLIRPSFQSLLPRCEFLAFESVEDQMKRIETLPLDSGVRVSGLVRGERFSLPEHYIYPSGV
jgi:hypothetical protein